jgi:CDP-paratose 2-epimerase
MKILITGGCGFLGSNLAAEAIKRGNELFVFDNLFRNGSEENLKWLQSLGNFKFYLKDVRNLKDVEFAIKESKPDVIFHMAGQVAMTTSVSDPRLDFEINALGTFNILESIKNHCPYTTIIYSSTNKVYGDFSQLNFIEESARYTCSEFPKGIREDFPLSFESPYGCSKGSADQYIIDFHRMYDLNGVVFRHSSMYGSNQRATIDQGWIGWFIKKGLEIKTKKNSDSLTICGNGKQVRDVLNSKDVVDLYFSSIENIELMKGNVFNIGGGYENSLSLLELFKIIEDELNIKMDYISLAPRKSDQLVFIADNNKINNFIGWHPKISANQGIKLAIDWAINNPF